eukprot:1146667-Pelagomonas_calceolata.AAC.4
MAKEIQTKHCTHFASKWWAMGSTSLRTSCGTRSASGSSSAMPVVPPSPAAPIPKSKSEVYLGGDGTSDGKEAHCEDQSSALAWGNLKP